MSVSIHIPDKVARIMAKLSERGFQAFLVGGSIRDALLGIPCEDHDLATDAKPEEIKKIFPRSRAVGQAFAVMLVEGVEVATFRLDGAYSDSRHPDSITYAKTIEEDLARRDFTINAMAYDGKTLIDPFGGETDLKNKTVRFVGSARDRIREDALRALRACRFAAKIGGDLEKKTFEAIRERNFSNKKVAFIENGTWAPMAHKVMKGMLEGCKNLVFAEPAVTIKSAMTDANKEQLEALADDLCQDYMARSPQTAKKNDMTALFRLGYGLYVVTCNDGKKDNGLIVNTVSQVSDNKIAVCINKRNYSCHVIEQSKTLNVNCLSVDAPFDIFKRFGFQSGRTVDKFQGIETAKSDNGLPFLTQYINAVLSLKVENQVDLESHIMFICSVTEARVTSDRATMTYTYYQENVKPKPQTEGKKGWVCKICGYIYEGEVLPDDFICPLCKHGAADFEKIK